MQEQNYWTRLRTSRISRRRLLKTAAVGGVGAAGIALVGCGDDDDEEEAVAAVAPTAEEPEPEVVVAAPAGPVLRAPVAPIRRRRGPAECGASRRGKQRSCSIRT